VQLKVKANEDSLAYPQQIDSQLAFLGIAVSDGTDSAPTDACVQQFNKLKQQADELIARWDQVQKTELANFQKTVAGQNIQAIVVPPPGEINGAGGEEPK
jgi:erythromycin esterase-like protein